MALPTDLAFFGDEENERLLRGLFGTIPALLKEVAPDGMEKSPFYFVFHKEDEAEYRTYRFLRAFRYLEQRQLDDRGRPKDELVPYRAPDKLSFPQFLLQHERKPAAMPHEIIAILARVCYQLTTNNCFLYRPHTARYRFPDFDRFNESVIATAGSMGLVDASNPYPLSYLLTKGYESFRTDFMPIQRHIFGFLAEQGLNWVFREYTFDFLLGLQRELEEKDAQASLGHDEPDMGMHEIIANYLRLDEPDESNGYQQVYPDFASSFSQYMGQEPKTELKAYRAVYGRWPEGYPPKMTDYI